MLRNFNNLLDLNGFSENVNFNSGKLYFFLHYYFILKNNHLCSHYDHHCMYYDLQINVTFYIRLQGNALYKSSIG